MKKATCGGVCQRMPLKKYILKKRKNLRKNPKAKARSQTPNFGAHK